MRPVINALGVLDGVTQEAFVAAHQALSRYDPNRSMQAWLTTIAVNKCRDWTRKRAVRRFLSFALPNDEQVQSIVDEQVPIDDAAGDRQELEAVLIAVGRQVSLRVAGHHVPLPVGAGLEGERLAALGVPDRGERLIAEMRAELVDRGDAATVLLLRDGRLDQKGLDEIAHLASSGRTSIPVDPEIANGLELAYEHTTSKETGFPSSSFSAYTIGPKAVYEIGLAPQTSAFIEGMIGIAKADLERLFEPFFTAKKPGGNGLGLWVSKTLMERYGGKLTAHSTPGHGARFTVWLRCEPIE